MKDFVDQHSEKITGVVSCFDRVLFKGYLPLRFGNAMERFISNQGLLLKDFKRFVTTHSETIKAHAEAMANKHERPFIYLQRNTIRKEDEARRLAQRDGVTQGLVCVFRALEGCQSFKLVPGEGRPRLENAPRKCLCYYFYWIDREFGLMHIRIQSWFPLVVQICLNGHEFLARKLDKHGCVLRVETVINHPRQFKVRRWGIRRGQRVMGWYPMAKGVANLYSYREISLTANQRYFQALSAAPDAATGHQNLTTLGRGHKGTRDVPIGASTSPTLTTSTCLPLC